MAGLELGLKARHGEPVADNVYRRREEPRRDGKRHTCSEQEEGGDSTP